MAVSPIGSVRFPELYEAVAVSKGDTPKFSTVLCYRPQDEAWLKLDGRAVDPDSGKEDWIQLILLRQLAVAANEASQTRFKCPLNGQVDGKPLESPFKRGEDKPKHYVPGDVMVRFATEYLPAVVDGGKQPLARASGLVYPGCLGRVTYKAATYVYMGKNGVNFYLNSFQRLGDGERIAHSDVEEFGDVSALPAHDDIPF